jgi:hypothetical protein
VSAVEKVLIEHSGLIAELQWRVDRLEDAREQRAEQTEQTRIDDEEDYKP